MLGYMGYLIRPYRGGQLALDFHHYPFFQAHREGFRNPHRLASFLESLSLDHLERRGITHVAMTFYVTTLRMFRHLGQCNLPISTAMPIAEWKKAVDYSSGPAASKPGFLQTAGRTFGLFFHHQLSKERRWEPPA